MALLFPLKNYSEYVKLADGTVYDNTFSLYPVHTTRVATEIRFRTIRARHYDDILQRKYSNGV